MSGLPDNIHLKPEGHKSEGVHQAIHKWLPCIYSGTYHSQLCN